MVICGTERIDPAKGPFIVLSDLGPEGLCVVSQHGELQDAILGLDTHGYSNLTIVKLVEFTLEVTV